MNVLILLILFLCPLDSVSSYPQIQRLLERDLIKQLKKYDELIFTEKDNSKKNILKKDFQKWLIMHEEVKKDLKYWEYLLNKYLPESVKFKKQGLEKSEKDIITIVAKQALDLYQNNNQKQTYKKLQLQDQTYYEKFLGDIYILFDSVLYLFQEQPSDKNKQQFFIKFYSENINKIFDIYELVKLITKRIKSSNMETQNQYIQLVDLLIFQNFGLKKNINGIWDQHINVQFIKSVCYYLSTLSQFIKTDYQDLMQFLINEAISNRDDQIQTMIFKLIETLLAYQKQNYQTNCESNVNQLFKNLVIVFFQNKSNYYLLNEQELKLFNKVIRFSKKLINYLDLVKPQQFQNQIFNSILYIEQQILKEDVVLVNNKWNFINAYYLKIIQEHNKFSQETINKVFQHLFQQFKQNDFTFHHSSQNNILGQYLRDSYQQDFDNYVLHTKKYKNYNYKQFYIINKLIENCLITSEFQKEILIQLGQYSVMFEQFAKGLKASFVDFIQGIIQNLNKCGNQLSELKNIIFILKEYEQKESYQSIAQILLDMKKLFQTYQQNNLEDILNQLSYDQIMNDIIKISMLIDSDKNTIFYIFEKASSHQQDEKYWQFYEKKSIPFYVFEGYMFFKQKLKKLLKGMISKGYQNFDLFFESNTKPLSDRIKIKIKENYQILKAKLNQEKSSLKKI